MNVKKFFSADPDCFPEPFEAATVSFTVANQKVLVELGLVKDNDKLYFSIGKRLPSDGTLIILDRMSLSSVSQKTFGGRPKYWSENMLYSREFLRHAFEDFIFGSPFKDFIRRNVNPLDITQLFAKLRNVSSNLINFQLGMCHEKGRRDQAVQGPSP